jgi:beta-N-acetylhexosaminidase
MSPNSPEFFGEQQGDQNGLEDTVKQRSLKALGTTGILKKEPVEATVPAGATDANLPEDAPVETINTVELENTPEEVPDVPDSAAAMGDSSMLPIDRPQKASLPRGRAILLAAFLLVVIINATTMGSGQFIGAQGWAYILSGSASTSNPDLLKNVANQFHHTLTPGVTAQPAQQVTPQEYINAIIQNMTLDQKLGQMMIVQFVGPDYGLDLSTMINQYNVGAVLLFTVNNNIQSKNQLRNVTAQMQKNSAIPLVIAIDQEGGRVDRLASLDGPHPSATSIGVTNDPNKAMDQGIEDAQDLSSYGFNLNLAPVVDVNNIFNDQLYLRTFGKNPTLVTQMAGAYLRGLQQSGKVLGALKHFPGLGDVANDPHISVPRLTRSLSQLESIDWAPYRSLIQQGNVHMVMVTHEIVTAVDNTQPSSLSYKLVTGILRDQMGFQGVIMTDSLTMEGITAFYSPGQAAALAIEAGSDLLMGARSPHEVAVMINGIKQAIAAGQISQKRINDSVYRILMLKYHMGLLHIPTT